ncbi:MAG TPA: ABC transporter ATP-binding protein [Galbitalea sp.]|jgi:ATP-binding cassette subfamily B protein
MAQPLTPEALPVDGRKPVRSLLRLFRPYRGSMLLATLIFIVKDSPIWILPILTGNIIDVVVSHRPLTQLWINAGVAAVILLMNYPLNVVYVHLFSNAVRHVAADLRNGMSSRLQLLTIGFHSRTSAAVIQSKVVRDAENVELAMNQSYGVGLSAVCVLLGALISTAIRVPAFVLVFLVIVPIAAALLILLRRRSSKLNESLRREFEHFSSRVGEMAALMPITRAHALEDVALARVSTSVEDVRSAAVALDKFNGRFGSITWISYQSLGVFCLVAAAFAALTRIVPITPGEVVLLSGYFTILTGSIVNLLNLLPVMTKARESMRSIAEVMQEPDVEQNTGKVPVQAVTGELRFDGLSYRYGETHRPALDRIELTINPGETVAFVGPSGSGKSTLLNVVLGFLRPTAGRLLLDGIDMQTVDLRTFRSRVSVVPQESVLFEGTIRENVTYGMSDISDQVVLDALRHANALEIVDALPDGWDTVVGERGARLSGGQRQRIAIARALIRNPRVLLLDEATSALDGESERLVQGAVERLMGGRTTLIVAHRLSTIRAADRIAVLDRGKLVEVGTHDELLARGGRYGALYAAQRF